MQVIFVNFNDYFLKIIINGLTVYFFSTSSYNHKYESVRFKTTIQKYFVQNVFSHTTYMFINLSVF